MKAPLQRRRFAYCHRKSNASQLTYKMAHLIPPYFLYRRRPISACAPLSLSLSLFVCSPPHPPFPSLSQLKHLKSDRVYRRAHTDNKRLWQLLTRHVKKNKKTTSKSDVRRPGMPPPPRKPIMMRSALFRQHRGPYHFLRESGGGRRARGRRVGGGKLIAVAALGRVAWLVVFAQAPAV